MTSPAPLLDERGRRALLVGAGLGVLFAVVPLFDRLLDPLTTLFHELGHAVAFWAFGYPAIPSFDFLWGGGVTLGLGRSTIFLLGIHLALAGCLWWWWQHFRPLVPIGVGFTLLYLLLAWTPGHLTIIAFAGHLAAMSLAGVFLYRGLTGVATRGLAEQTLYFACGLYVLFSEMGFAWGLMHDEVLRQRYRHSPKAINDLVLVAADFGITLEGAAGLYLLICALAPIVLWLAVRGRSSAAPVPSPVESAPELWTGPAEIERGACPSCLTNLLEPGPEGLVCERCGGSLVEPARAASLLQRGLGLAPGVLEQMLASYFGPEAPCGYCEAGLARVTLKGVEVDICRSCGAIWLDGGELSRLMERIRATRGPIKTPGSTPA